MRFRSKILFLRQYRPFILLFTVLLSVYVFQSIFGYHVTIIGIRNPQYEKQQESEEVKTMKIDDDCTCKDKDGNSYDFCYSKNGIMGKRFGCEHVERVRELGVLSDGKLSIDFKGNVNPIREQNGLPVIVTAWSDGHHEKGMRLLFRIRSISLNWQVIVYNLGLSAKQQKDIQNVCGVELREFHFGKYPDYMRRLMEYRWKPIIAAETLREFGAIWWLDSSVEFNKAELDHVYQLIECRKTVPHPATVPSDSERDTREAETEHESGWDKKIWEENVKNCDKSPILLHGFTGHGSYPVTGKFMYDFIPTNLTLIKKVKAKMYDATLIFAVRTKDAVDDVLKWWVLCALEEQCMAGKNMGVFCSLGIGEQRFTSEPNCHRFDQSALNILLANSNHYDRKYYVSEIVDYFKIQRGATDSGFNFDSVCKRTRVL